MHVPNHNDFFSQYKCQLDVIQTELRHGTKLMSYKWSFGNPAFEHTTSGSQFTSASVTRPSLSLQRRKKSYICVYGDNVIKSDNLSN